MDRNTLQSPLQRPARGIILLLVLGILGLMSVLALSFVSMARLERGMARNYVESVRAKMAAESGVEKALVCLDEFIGTPTIEQLTRLRGGYGPTSPMPFYTGKPAFAYDSDGDGDIDTDDVSGTLGTTGEDALTSYAGSRRKRQIERQRR